MRRGRRAMGRGRQGGGKRRGDFTDGYDDMPGWTDGSLGGMKLQSFLTLFTRATPGIPASIYIIHLHPHISPRYKSHVTPAVYFKEFNEEGYEKPLGVFFFKYKLIKYLWKLVLRE